MQRKHFGEGRLGPEALLGYFCFANRKYMRATGSERSLFKIVGIFGSQHITKWYNRRAERYGLTVGGFGGHYLPYGFIIVVVSIVRCLIPDPQTDEHGYSQAYR